MRREGIAGAGRWFGLLGSLDLARFFENLHFELRPQFCTGMAESQNDIFRCAL